jgi:hypothetical protein
LGPREEGGGAKALEGVSTSLPSGKGGRLGTKDRERMEVDQMSREGRQDGHHGGMGHSFRERSNP